MKLNEAVRLLILALRCVKAGDKASCAALVLDAVVLLNDWLAEEGPVTAGEEPYFWEEEQCH